MRAGARGARTARGAVGPGRKTAAGPCPYGGGVPYGPSPVYGSPRSSALNKVPFDRSPDISQTIPPSSPFSLM